MAPSQSQVVTFAAGSALVLGVIFTIYLVKRRSQPKKAKGNGADSANKEDNSSNNAESEQREPSFEVPRDDDNGPPLPDKNGLSVSTSWAILNNNSNSNSPQLSPVTIDESELEMLDDSSIQDDTQQQTVLEVSQSESTLLLEKVPQASVMSTLEREVVSIEEINVQYEELLKEHKATGPQSYTSEEITEALMATQKPAHGLTERNSEVLVWLLSHNDDHLKHTAVRGIANCATFTKNQTSKPGLVWERVKEHKATGPQSYTSEEITEALMATQKPAHGLTERNSEVLVWLLSHNDDHLKHTAVRGIANCATFTKNQNILREKGCLPRLAKLLEIQRMAMWLRHSSAPMSISSTLNAVTNLAANEQNNKSMQDCVPTLVDVSIDKETGESVCLSSLQALTNLSVTSEHHGHYTRLVQRLYEFLEVGSTGIRLQSIKILINLSCYTDMVPHLLAAKAPSKMLDFLQPSLTPESLVLRFLTLLANILHVVKEKSITSSSLPSLDKAASPETMYTALLGVNNVGNVKNKAFLLCKHGNEDIKTTAVRVYSYLK